jgi:hypothetical protein
MPERLRLAFIGQHEYFGYTALQETAAGVEPRFFHLHHGGKLESVLPSLQAFAPDVVLAYRPELYEAGAFDDIDAITIGYLTEPLPRPDRPPHADQADRLRQLHASDPNNFDRICSYDPYIEQAASEVFEIWRSFPIPVADGEFSTAPLKAPAGEPVLLFAGRGTPHRNQFLDGLKKDFDVVHLAHGVTDERMAPFLAEADIAINLHNHPYLNYENRVSHSLAAGLAVISEPLSPRWGLVPGSDYLEVSDRWDLYDAVVALAATPDALRTMRINARRKAERFRASRIWPALAREAIADVEAFGGRRAGRAAAGSLA